MITFLSPLFLIGLLAAGIPLLIHLSRSRRTKKIRFSSTRFFTDHFLRSYRMSRLKELLLLACRMLLFGLLAVALARPLVMPKGAAFHTGGSRAVVLVIDNSASMGYREDGRTLFDQARQAASTIVENLAPGDTVGIVLASHRAGGLQMPLPEPTADRQAIRRQLETVHVEALGTDLDGAVSGAQRLLMGRPESSKEIYVLSDLQDSGWGSGVPHAEAGDANISYAFISIRPRQAQNLAVTAVQYEAARPVVGIPFLIRPHIRSQGERSRPSDVRLYIDGEKVSERPLAALPNGRWAVPSLSHRFTTGGWHTGYVEVDDDTLAVDNRRFFALNVLDHLHVLAVDGAPSAIPRLDAMFFLKAALEAAGGRQSAIQVDTVGAQEVAQKKLADYPLVILANVATLSEPAVATLEEFVDQGGSLFVFLGDKVESDSYNQNLTGATHLHGGLLPGRLIQRLGDAAASDAFARVDAVALDHPALSAFADPPARLDNVTFQALWQIQPDDGMVLMQAAARGRSYPLLCEKNFGKGRVMLFTSTCDRAWTNFPVRPAYVLWLHRLVGYLAQQPLGREPFFTTGDLLPVPVSATEGLPRVQVKKPDGSIGYPSTTGNPDTPLGFTETERPGIYRLIDLDHHQERAVAVNLESYESNLTYLDDVLGEKEPADQRQGAIENGLRKLVGEPAQLTFVDDPAKLADVVNGTRRGLRLWDLLLWIVLGVALCEPWLANRISLRHYARPERKDAVDNPVTVSVAREPRETVVGGKVE